MKPLLAVVWDFCILCLFTKLLSDTSWLRVGSITHGTIPVAGISCNYFPAILIFFSFVGVQVSVTNYFIFFAKIRPAKLKKRRRAEGMNTIICRYIYTNPANLFGL